MAANALVAYNGLPQNTPIADLTAAEKRRANTRRIYLWVFWSQANFDNLSISMDMKDLLVQAIMNTAVNNNTAGWQVVVSFLPSNVQRQFYENLHEKSLFHVGAFTRDQYLSCIPKIYSSPPAFYSKFFI